MSQVRHKAAYVSWTPYFGRSQSYIDSLDLVPIYVHYFEEHNPIYAPIKYGPMFVATLAALFRARPNVVFVMDPPVFATSAVHLYCLVTRSRFVMDCHSGVFESKKWQWLLPLQRLYGRRAEGVIVTNSVHQGLVQAWGARALIIGDPPLHIPAGGSTGGGSADVAEPFVFVVNRFHNDEAVTDVIDAARRTPDVRFVISGDLKKAKPEWLEHTPANATFTGWLSVEEFWSYARRATAIVVLTTQDNTILRGGWEAMFLGKPLVTSSTAALRGYFTGGAVFVENTGPGISAGVRDAILRADDLASAMSRFADEKRAEWERSRDELEDLLGMQFDAPRTNA